MNFNAIVAARMTSSRLPGKVLMDLEGKPALIRLIERLRQSKYIEKIVIATTTNPEDDIIAETAVHEGVFCYRGSEEDVLKRTVEAAEETKTEYIVQVTSDCPLIDSETVDGVIVQMANHPYLDYVANQLIRTYPLGYSVEVFRTESLRHIEQTVLDPVVREHVTPYFYENPEIYKLSNIEAPPYLRHPEYRLTLDTQEDYNLISQIFAGLYPLNNNFTLYDIVKYLVANPRLLELNKSIVQKKAR